MNEPHFEVFPGEPAKVGFGGEHLLAAGVHPDEFYWRFRDANGRITFTGGESFTRRKDAHRSIAGACTDIVAAALGEPTPRELLEMPIIDLDEDGEVIA